MKIFLLAITAIFLAWNPAPAYPEAAGPTVMAAASDNEEVAEDMTREDESPLDEFDPEEATWEAWAGPLLLAVFGVVLVLLIMRFTLLKKRKRDEQ